MPQIPENFGVNNPKPKLAPQEKIDYINYIVNFLTYKDDHEKTIYFKFHNISLRNSPEFLNCNEQDFSSTSLEHSLLSHANDDDIANFSCKILYPNSHIA